MHKCTKIGIVGLGTVGTGVTKLIEKNKDLIRKRCGFDIEIGWLCDIDLERDRGIDLSKYRCTTNYMDVIEDDEVDIVVELVGGTGVAFDIIAQALKRGKSIVTANKALIAKRGKELIELLKNSPKSEIGFEASVGGGIPIIKTIKESLAGNRIKSIYGIINGTVNYILTRMEKDNVDFSTALKEAQKKGYAEADPSLDIDGIDAAHKASILATITFGRFIGIEDVFVEGISNIDLMDIKFSLELGYRIKLLAIIKENKGEIEIRVHPTLIPLEHPLAKIDGVYNALSIFADFAGHIMVYGKGAGMYPTASSVIADIIDISRNIKNSSTNRVPIFSFVDEIDVKIKPVEEIVTNYYLRIMAVDKPGVLSKISGILAKQEISIEAVIQKGRGEKDLVPIVMTTHEAKEKSIQKAIEEISSLDIVGGKPILYRIERLEDGPLM
ncbi:MAG: homoserine dehydrogenase [Thermosulfidibacteraceae bacterium]